jgi:hypothetical protein
MAQPKTHRAIPCRTVLLLLCLLGIPCTPFAQTKHSSWENLGALQPGQRIEIVDMAAEKDSATFVNVSDTAISFRDAGGDKTLSKQDVRRVKLKENRSRWHNTLMGAGVGAGVGAGATAAAWENHGFLGTKATGAAVGAVIGGVSGAIVGALLPSHRVIYRAISPQDASH